MSWLLKALAGVAMCGAGLVAQAQAQGEAFTPAGSLTAFADEAALQAWFEPFVVERRRREEERRRQEEERRLRQEEVRKKWEAENPGKTWASRPNPPAPTAMAAPAPAPAAAGASESITNNQTAGVDEGGIVKVHGKHLVILRRGRLFTVDVDRHQLLPVSSINAYAPDVNPSGAWYDEMMVSGNTVAVIGYSYSRGGTELGLFNIDDAGKLSYRATYHVRSSDYYSSRNYASRLIGSELILYTPIPLNVWHADPAARLPAMRRWQPGATPADFKRIADATRIYRTDEPLNPQEGITLHTIVRCDLALPELDCRSSAVLGPAGRVFYVSSRAVYVWTTRNQRDAASGRVASQSAVFRLPLDGAAPSMLKTQGSPIDQMSFLEGDDGYLNVLLRANGNGDGMWRGESSGGNLSLLRVPVRDFGDGHTRAGEQAYTRLPAAGDGSLQNRFVGQRLLYGAGSGWRRPAPGTVGQLQVVHVTDRARTETLTLPHGVDRIEALGADAIAVGTDGQDLHFSSVQLAPRARVAGRYVQAQAAQGETRSHGFFYKPDDATSGVVGLPVRGAGQGGYRQLWDEPAGMLYLRNSRLKLSGIGSLASRPGVGRDDGCRASCTDWYGNARPIFLRNRVFALLGYELVEGRILTAPGGSGRLVETRRISFAPGSADYPH
ncbi:MAG: beta-propeller domain-containing protein [Polaromonas sp.]|uniref:beta-propeller domain-containing protein n=1 Tax=Polaromonas sp. TaxID=1869339 RepID=UPI002722D6E1|nr:beta-propeller domain-containing protein [Polaromonas sp.]MDO9115055.1 beta-propeller domain-containing protein [Polaromonas sp.]MDP1884873.1 beta-propeller domain-containing protein [Polaromonas sp.]